MYIKFYNNSKTMWISVNPKSQNLKITINNKFEKQMIAWGVNTKIISNPILSGNYWEYIIKIINRY